MSAPRVIDRLLALVLEREPTARVVSRAPKGVSLVIGPLVVFITEDMTAAELAAVVTVAKPQKARGVEMAFIAIETLSVLAAKDVFAENISTLDALGGVFATVWRPGKGIERVRGGVWGTLKKCVAAFEAGAAVPELEPLLAARTTSNDAVQTFLEPLLKRKPVVTWAIAAGSVALFALQYYWGLGQPTFAAIRMGASLRSLILEGQVWRLLAPMALHGSVIHLVLNMVALFSFGTFLEQFLGPRRYLILYVASGLGGSLASLVRPTEVLSVGASGGIWGLMIAGAALVTWPRGRLPEEIALVQRSRIWWPVVVNAGYSFAPGIDLLAHFGGGLFGGLLMFTGAITSGLSSLQVPSERALIRLTAWVLGLAFVGSIAMALFTGQPWELRGRPALHTSAMSNGLSVDVPTMATKPTIELDGRATTFGSLRYDPIAVNVEVGATPVSADEQANARQALSEAIEALKKGAPWPEFHFATQLELRDHEGVPYLFSEQVANDNDRTIRLYCFIRGEKQVWVSVLLNSIASAGWHDVAAELPFTVR